MAQQDKSIGGQTHTSLPNAQTIYREALKRIAGATANRALTAGELDSLQLLNATYYLESYLPSDIYHTALAQATSRTANSAERDAAGADRGARTALARTARRHSATIPLTRTGIDKLVHLAITRQAPLAPLVAVHHLAEVLAELPAEMRPQLLQSAAFAIQRIPRRHDEAPLLVAPAEVLRCWALQNERPPRTGEVSRWATCLLHGDPARVLRDALASGLGFTALFDVLSLAAARLTARLASSSGRLSDEIGLTLPAAHAVRRLSEISETPPVDGWLAVARIVNGQVLAQRGRMAGSPSEVELRPESLALRAVNSGDPFGIRLTEAVLAEAESMPVEYRPVLLHALDAFMRTGSAQQDGDKETKV